MWQNSVPFFSCPKVLTRPRWGCGMKSLSQGVSFLGRAYSFSSPGAWSELFICYTYWVGGGALNVLKGKSYAQSYQEAMNGERVFGY